MFYIRYLVSSDIPDIEKPSRCCDTFKIACETLSIVGGHEPKFEKIQNFPRSSKMSSRVFRKIFLIVFGSKWCAALSSVFFSGAPYGQKLDFNVELVIDLHMSKTVRYNMFYIRYLVSSDIFDIENRFRCCDTFKFACEPLSIVGGHEPKFEKKKKSPDPQI